MNGRSKQDAPQLPFFVYGTLLPGQPNAFLWQEMKTHVEPAKLDNGRLHDMGGYPMLGDSFRLDQRDLSFPRRRESTGEDGFLPSQE